MSFEYQALVGLPYELGRNDCYSLIRDFYDINFGLKFTNYARPDFWWDHGLDLYMENMRAEGFRVFDGHPKDYQPGDGFLMAIKSPVANHGAILLHDGRILHHLAGCLSRVETYNRSFFRDATVAVVRHPAVTAALPKVATTNLDLMELLDPNVRAKLAAALPPGRIGEGGLHPQDG